MGGRCGQLERLELLAAQPGVPGVGVERRDALQAWLKEKGIGSSVYYPLPLHLQPCFEYLGYSEGAFPVSEQAAKEVISLPIYPELAQSQLDEVIAAVREFYGNE